MQLAFDPVLRAAAPRFCDELTAAIVALEPRVSVAISAVPRPPGALAVLLEPPVLPICLAATEALCGPIHAPGRWPCADCLDHWLAMNLFDAAGGVEASDDLVPLVAKAIEMLSIEAAATEPAHVRHDAISLRVGTDRPGRHAVFPRLDCPRCGDAAPRPLPLRSHCSPWTGIVNRVELTAHPTAGAYRATAGWASPLPQPGARHLLKRQDSFGRGCTPADAEAGCIGEAIERYSLIYRGDEPLVRARIDDVDAMHPDRIQLFSAAQYHDREAWNAAADEEMHVPAPFDPAIAIDWLEAKALRGTRHRLVPAACCLMWYEGRPGEPEFARADTIGCAAGTTWDDAVTGALLEWIERDAMAIWWDNRLRRPGLRPESFGSPEIDEVVAGLAAIGRRLFLLDCTTDVGIPAYVSIAPRHDGSEPLISSAADLSPRRAAVRAATEVGQVWYEAQRSRSLAPVIHRWLTAATITTDPYLAPIELIDAPPEPAAGTTRAWIRIVEQLEAVGLEAYAVDHSRADVTLRTVRAVVPGLRHIWNRRAPGRLYDVPVAMGWLERPPAEIDLNPIRCWL